MRDARSAWAGGRGSAQRLPNAAAFRDRARASTSPVSHSRARARRLPSSGPTRRPHAGPRVSLPHATREPRSHAPARERLAARCLPTRCLPTSRLFPFVGAGELGGTTTSLSAESHGWSQPQPYDVRLCRQLHHLQRFRMDDRCDAQCLWLGRRIRPSMYTALYGVYIPLELMYAILPLMNIRQASYLRKRSHRTRIKLTISTCSEGRCTYHLEWCTYPLGRCAYPSGAAHTPSPSAHALLVPQPPEAASRPAWSALSCSVAAQGYQSRGGRGRSLSRTVVR